MKVTRPKLKFWERTYFPAILQGLALTFSHIFRRSVTLEYPETRWSLPCIFCGYCQEVCPVEAIWLKETFELADYERPNLVFNKDKLLEMGRKPPYLQGKEQPIEAQR
ncbi:MAG: 4Fe-4S binding protein [Acidobacteriota bacterium]